mmetsp:Transcript_16500/g.25622  ORF Transcript_16500/g.25622 Transcript_16500/m.25622 type:complete len:103 (+) Transcript_16500:123-431(+)
MCTLKASCVALVFLFLFHSLDSGLRALFYSYHKRDCSSSSRSWLRCTPRFQALPASPSAPRPLRPSGQLLLLQFMTHPASIAPLAGRRLDFVASRQTTCTSR